jgi:hypothetical protein
VIIKILDDDALEDLDNKHGILRRFGVSVPIQRSPVSPQQRTWDSNTAAPKSSVDTTHGQREISSPTTLKLGIPVIPILCSGDATWYCLLLPGYSLRNMCFSL